MKLNKYIDHTLLKPEATHEDIRKVCAEAIQYDTASVCVNPIYARFVTEQLTGTGIKTCCVVGFPLGATLSAKPLRPKPPFVTAQRRSTWSFPSALPVKEIGTMCRPTLLPLQKPAREKPC